MRDSGRTLEGEVRDCLLAGRTEFLGVELLVAPGALVPREETELLGETAIKWLELEGRDELLVIDMCCGVGNLACALAAQVRRARIWGSDLTDQTVGLARRNAELLDLTDRVTIWQGDLFAPLRDRELEGRIDMIVCNPPYISSGRLERDRKQLLEHEPREAFDGGPYGLAIQQRVIRDGADFLRPGGALAFEIGLGQERQITALFARRRVWDDVDLVNDAQGNPRVAVARRKKRDP